MGSEMPSRLMSPIRAVGIGQRPLWLLEREWALRGAAVLTGGDVDDRPSQQTNARLQIAVARVTLNP